MKFSHLVALIGCSEAIAITKGPRRNGGSNEEKYMGVYDKYRQLD
jgi:hypothetical protein